MKDENLVLTETTDGKICKIAAKGRVDANSSDVLLHKLEKTLKDGKSKIIMDMSEVDYLSSIGIRAILTIFKHAKEAGGYFKISYPSEIVKNLLGMAALKQMLLD